MKRGRIIALLSQKGGSGKTTVTMQLAAGLAARGHRVVIGDLDPQESASRWAEAAGAGAPFPAAVIRPAGDSAALDGALRATVRDVDYLLLDCPPSIEHRHTLGALAATDLAVVPVVPSPTDLWSTRAVEHLILLHMAQRPRLRAALLPNRVQRTGLAGDVLEVMREFRLPVLAAALSQRNAYAQSAVAGASVYQLGRSAVAARTEVERLVDAVIHQLGE
jgi:chromosome partitioning protein